ncbi:hypothetical protein D3C76_1683770 [compost metagenome]
MLAQFDLQLLGSTEYQHSIGRTEQAHRLAHIEPLQASTVTVGPVDQVEVADRAAEQVARHSALATEGKGIKGQQFARAMAIDSQHHAIALQHGNDALIAGEA